MYALPPRGLHNNGIICFLNSLLQALMSCTSLTDIVLNTDTTHPIGILYKKMLADAIAGNRIDYYSEILINAISTTLNKKNVIFGNMQEDCFECLTYMLDILNDNTVTRLFEHRYELNIQCCACHNIVRKEDTSIAMIVQKSDTTDIYNSIRRQYPLIDNYRCSSCGDMDHMRYVRALRMLPEILILILDKYNEKWNSDFPHELEFPSTNGNKLRFSIIAQIHHSGSISGGHYWATCKRQNGIYTFNDDTVHADSFKPTRETYMLWYHICD